MAATLRSLNISSDAFAHNGKIPEKYSCEGDNINPPLTIGETPEETQSVVLIMDDPDAPNGVFTHWVMWNILPYEDIEEDDAPGDEGKNGRGETGYTGPCPPSGIHRYYFKVYALDIILDLKKDSDKQTVVEAMHGHILASGELIGLYSKGNL
jgi:Raf kinase inhibitor-like YbhB/YbcL family protein